MLACPAEACDMGSTSDSLSLRSYGAAHGSHVHDHFQILVGLSGFLELEVEGFGQRIGAGQGCVIGPGSRHDFEARRGSHCLVLDSGSNGWERLEGTAPAARHMPVLIGYLAEALQAGDPVAAAHGPSLLLQTWGGTSPRMGPTRGRRVDWAALASWAQWRLQGSLTVAQLARQACLSPSQFALRCRQENGQSAMAWLRTLRLQRARALRAAGQSVADTARQTGYRSPSALTAALRRSASTG
jgi:AraC-like DNA-binding protein